MLQFRFLQHLAFHLLFYYQFSSKLLLRSKTSHWCNTTNSVLRAGSTLLFGDVFAFLQPQALGMFFFCFLLSLCFFPHSLIHHLILPVSYPPANLYLLLRSSSIIRATFFSSVIPRGKEDGEKTASANGLVFLYCFYCCKTPLLLFFSFPVFISAGVIIYLHLIFHSPDPIYIRTVVHRCLIRCNCNRKSARERDIQREKGFRFGA